MLAQLWGVAMQREIGDQRLEARCIDFRYQPAIADQAEIAEQSNLYDRWQRRDLRNFLPGIVGARWLKWLKYSPTAYHLIWHSVIAANGG